MQLGMFMQPVHDPKRDYTQALADDRETIILADQLGFSEVWVGEHVSATAEPITAPLVFLGTLIEQTKQIKLGTGVFCLPLQHPAIVAGQSAMFDHLSKGRFQMGIGTGGLASDVELFGVGGNVDRAEMVRESIDMILAIWDGEAPYDLKGKYWSTEIKDISRLEYGVGEFPKPYQQPHPPIAISLMSPGSSSALMAGERGWIPISGANLVQPRYISSHWDRYVEGCDKRGVKADSSIWRVSRSIVVAPSDEEAREYLLREDGAFSFWFRYIVSSFRQRGALAALAPDGHPDPDALTWQEAAESMVSWGSVETVTDKLVALRDTVGDFGTLTITAHEWDDPAFCKRSMRMLAEEVMPKFSQHADATRAA
ncbi:MAG: LLM class flavin-dependent oxidoreductase [Gammaproteobacteria bacterium]|nr:LLM class flavin-dependent oxidoreductase [Gammaproteobacteria bacterium]